MVFVLQPHSSAYAPFSSPYMFSGPQLFVLAADDLNNKTISKVDEKNAIQTKTDSKSAIESSNAASESSKLSHKEKAGPVVYRLGNFFVTDKEEGYHLTVDLPGVKAENLKIDEHDGTLRISAERKSGDKVVSSFSQSLEFDSKTTDLSNVDAHLSDGVLSVTIPKKKMEAPKPVNISIMAAEPPTEEEKGEKKAVFLTMDVPGVKLSDIRLEYSNGELQIHGQRKNVQTGRNTEIHRVFTVSEKAIDTSLLEAFLMDGVLTIKAPIRAAPPSKAIKISTEKVEAPVSKLKEDDSSSCSSTKASGVSEVVVVENADEDD